MLSRIRELLRSETAADIEAALASFDIDALRSAHAAAVEARTALLLSGTDAQLLKAEAAIEAARLAVDRADAAKGALEAKLATAKATEAEAAFRARYAAVVAQRNNVVDLIQKEYAAAAAKVAGVLAADREASVAVRAVNKACTEDESYGLPAILTASQFVWGGQFPNIGLGIADISSFTTLLPTKAAPAIDPYGAMHR